MHLDNLVVYSDPWHSNTRIQRIRDLFEAHLTVNLVNCEFARTTVSYLGRVVGQGNVVPV